MLEKKMWHEQKSELVTNTVSLDKSRKLSRKEIPKLKMSEDQIKGIAFRTQGIFGDLHGEIDVISKNLAEDYSKEKCSEGWEIVKQAFYSTNRCAGNPISNFGSYVILKNKENQQLLLTLQTITRCGAPRGSASTSRTFVEIPIAWDGDTNFEYVKLALIDEGSPYHGPTGKGYYLEISGIGDLAGQMQENRLYLTHDFSSVESRTPITYQFTDSFGYVVECPIYEDNEGVLHFTYGKGSISINHKKYDVFVEEGQKSRIRVVDREYIEYELPPTIKVSKGFHAPSNSNLTQKIELVHKRIQDEKEKSASEDTTASRNSMCLTC